MPTVKTNAIFRKATLAAVLLACVTGQDYLVAQPEQKSEDHAPACMSSARMGHVGFQAKRELKPMLIGLV